MSGSGVYVVRVQHKAGDGSAWYLGTLGSYHDQPSEALQFASWLEAERRADDECKVNSAVDCRVELVREVDVKIQAGQQGLFA